VKHKILYLETHPPS